MIKKRNNKEGFTLVEVIFALAIFSIGILSMYKLLVNNLFIMDKLLIYHEAHEIGSKYIEDIISNFNTKSLKAKQISKNGRFSNYQIKQNTYKQNMLFMDGIYKIVVTVHDVEKTNLEYKLVYYYCE